GPITARNHQTTDPIVGIELGDGLSELGHELIGQGVQSLRPIQGNDTDPIAKFDQNVSIAAHELPSLSLSPLDLDGSAARMRPLRGPPLRPVCLRPRAAGSAPRENGWRQRRYHRDWRWPPGSRRWR